MRHCRFRPHYLAAALIVLATASCRPKGPKVVPIDAILPDPVPAAPLAHWTAAPDRIPISVERSGATLRGWTFEVSPGARRPLTILFFNGNAMDIDDSQPIYRRISAQGANLTAFDYRGYGFSSGMPHVMGFREDAVAEYDRLTASGPVVVYGFSMGTAMACWVASQRRVAGLILAGTIASAHEEFPVFARAQGYSAEEIAKMVPSPEAIAALDDANLIRQSQAPLLMLHGEDDRLVPIQQGREVFDASPAVHKSFVSLPANGHNETVEASGALLAVRSFLSGFAN